MSAPPPPPITSLPPPSQPSSTTTTSPEQQKPNELKNPGELEELGKRAKGTFQMHFGLFGTNIYISTSLFRLCYK